MTESGKSKVFDVIGIVILLLSVCFCVLGIARLQSNTEDILQWLPDDSAARVKFDGFREKFGADDFLIVTWTDCTTDDPRLTDFTQRVIDQDSRDLIESVISGAQIIDELTANDRLTRRSVEKRFRGIFFGVKDTDQTLAVVELSKKGSANRKESLEVVKAAIDQTADLAIENVTFGGAPYVGIKVDLQMKNTFKFFVILSVLLASLVSFYCLKDLYLSIIVCITAGIAAACSVAIVPVLGLKFSGLMSIIPALVSVSYTHLTLPTTPYV